MTCFPGFFSLILIFVNISQAQTWHGFHKESNATSKDISAYILRTVETKNEIRVLLSNHSAFYIFPTNSKNRAVLKEVFEQSQKMKSALDWKVDPFNRNIFEVSKADN